MEVLNILTYGSIIFFIYNKLFWQYFGNPKKSVIDQSYFTAQSPPIMAKDKTSPCS